MPFPDVRLFPGVLIMETDGQMAEALGALQADVFRFALLGAGEGDVAEWLAARAHEV